jgi:hypothetical protein
LVDVSRYRASIHVRSGNCVLWNNVPLIKVV